MDSVCLLLADLDTVTKKLEDPALNIFDVHMLFDGVLKRQRSTSAGLMPNTDIMLSLSF